MRNLEERVAEISRRSEVILKARRQRRKHILTACVPLVLCIGLSSAFFFAGYSVKDTAPEDNGDRYVGGTEAAGMPESFAGKVEVSGTGTSYTSASTENAQKIMGLINGIVAIQGTVDKPDYGFEANDGLIGDIGAIQGTVEDGSNDFETNGNTVDRSETYGEDGYSVTVTHEDGTVAEYYLIGSQLIDKNTKEVFPLEEETCLELKDALGIPHN